MSWIWLALTVIFVVVEALTSQLVSIWFVAGSVAALLLSLFEISIPFQAVAFIAVSCLVLVLFRPIIKKRAMQAAVPTNADMVIGKTAVVISEIDNDRAAGRVEIGGLDWAARSADGATIEKDAKVKVVRIEGVKLIVTLKD